MWICYWSYVKQLGMFKINLVFIIVSVFAGYNKIFRKSVRVSDDNILMNIWLYEQFDLTKFLGPI